MGQVDSMEKDMWEYIMKGFNSAWLSIAWWWQPSLKTRLKRSWDRPSRLFMVSVSVISLWRTTRKEGTRQRWKDWRVERKRVFCQTVHTSSRGKGEEMRECEEELRKGRFGGAWQCFSQRSFCVYCLCGCVSLHCVIIIRGPLHPGVESWV